MQHSFSELVMSGSFSVIKGFLLGFLSHHAPSAQYFFYQKSGIIRHDSLAGHLKDFLEIEQRVYLCLEDEVYHAFEASVEWAGQKIGIGILERKPIASADLDFSFIIYNREIAEACQKVFTDIPPGVTLHGFSPEEEIDEKAPEISFTGSAHPYCYKGQGTLSGAFSGIVELFLRSKRSRCSDFIDCGKIQLHFEEPVLV
jgi:hypothetical protein